MDEYWDLPSQVAGLRPAEASALMAAAGVLEAANKDPYRTMGLVAIGSHHEAVLQPL